jgi:hypothetical protein
MFCGITPKYISSGPPLPGGNVAQAHSLPKHTPSLATLRRTAGE